MKPTYTITAHAVNAITVRQPIGDLHGRRYLGPQCASNSILRLGATVPCGASAGSASVNRTLQRISDQLNGVKAGAI